MTMPSTCVLDSWILAALESLMRSRGRLTSEVRKVDQTATMNQHDRMSVNVFDDASKSRSKHCPKVLKSSKLSCIA
jgi:hypothetical protein